MAFWNYVIYAKTDFSVVDFDGNITSNASITLPQKVTHTLAPMVFGKPEASDYFAALSQILQSTCDLSFLSAFSLFSALSCPSLCIGRSAYRAPGLANRVAEILSFLSSEARRLAEDASP